jgi:thiamine pyrophosphokinase
MKGDFIMERAIVFINGQLKGEASFYHQFITSEDFIACADGGANYTYQLGLLPDLIVGDLDSLTEDRITYYKNQGVKFDRYPVEKDKTDTQLLLEQLIKTGYQEIIVFAALGNRLDHALGNIYLLEELARPEVAVKFISPEEQIELITEERIVKGEEGKKLSLLPLTREVTGVKLTGVKYELQDGSFHRGDTLGMSNVVTANKAKIKLETGKLLMILTP